MIISTKKSEVYCIHICSKVQFNIICNICRLCQSVVCTCTAHINVCVIFSAKNMDDDDFIFFATCAVVLATAFISLMDRRGRRYWVHPDNRNTIYTEGEYFTLFLQMKTRSQDRFFHYTRMEVWQWEELLQLVKPFLRKTSIRTPICEEERLAITIRYPTSF